MVRFRRNIPDTQEKPALYRSKPEFLGAYWELGVVRLRVRTSVDKWAEV